VGIPTVQCRISAETAASSQPRGSASDWTKALLEGKRVKHIDIIHHFARNHVASGELSFVYCKSEDNVSDCLAKALPRSLIEKGLAGLGMD
jgi:hypothetical protein